MRFNKCKEKLPGGAACGQDHNTVLHDCGVPYVNTGLASAKTKVQPKSTPIQGLTKEQAIFMSLKVLLEIQKIKLHGRLVTTLFDNGSTASLVTHNFAEKVKLPGVKVKYYLQVLGSGYVIKETTLYTMTMRDRFGKGHKVYLLGIDKITDKDSNVCLDKMKELFPEAPEEV